MILEADRMVADWFGDAVQGVNALLPTTPLDTGDVAPAVIATIADETRDGNVARGLPPETLPAVCVSVDKIHELDGEVVQVTRDGKIKLHVRVCISDNVTADGVRDLSYYLRTVMRSLRRLFDAPNVARTRNNIYLETCLDMALQIATVHEQAGAAPLSGYIIATLQLRDLTP